LRHGLEQSLILLRTSLQGGPLLVDALEHLESLDGVYDFVRQYFRRYLTFREVIHRSRLHGVDRQFFSTARRKHNDSARQAVILAAQARQHFQAVHIRQVEIQQNTIRLPGSRQFDPPGSRARLGKIELKGARVF
jgi:hypothetical protein